MKQVLFPALISAVALTGCARISDSRLNPFNWFSKSQADVVTASGEIRPLVDPSRISQIIDNRSLIRQVTALSIERTSGGAIVKATGLAETQGYFNAQLVIATSEGSTLTLEFRAQRLGDLQIAGPAATREITAARVLTDDDLAGVRTIRVVGAENSRSSRR